MLKVIRFYCLPKNGVKDLDFLKNKFLDSSKEYIDKITKVLYYGNPEFSNFKINKIDDFYLRLKKKIKFLPIRITTDKTVFLKESRILSKVIEKNLNKKIKKNQNVVLNQASNIFDPVRSSQYFENSKIIIVTRDPKRYFLEHENLEGLKG